MLPDVLGDAPDTEFERSISPFCYFYISFLSFSLVGRSATRFLSSCVEKKKQKKKGRKRLDQKVLCHKKAIENGLCISHNGQTLFLWAELRLPTRTMSMI